MDVTLKPDLFHKNNEGVLLQGTPSSKFSLSRSGSLAVFTTTAGVSFYRDRPQLLLKRAGSSFRSPDAIGALTVNLPDPQNLVKLHNPPPEAYTPLCISSFIFI